MKRWIIYVLLTVITAAGMPTLANTPDRDHKNSNNSALKMSPRKLSKRTARLRRSRNSNRKKQMASIKKSNQQRQNKRR